MGRQVAAFSRDLLFYKYLYDKISVRVEQLICIYYIFVLSLIFERIKMISNNSLQAHRYLLQFSIKPSVQRTAVMEYLLKHRTHPTIDEIYMALSPNMPTLSKTTVYNTLNLFVEKGAVQALVIDDKNARYDVDTSAHAHFLCKSCGKVYDIFNLKPELFQLPENTGFSIHSVEIAYSGICNVCRES